MSNVSIQTNSLVLDIQGIVSKAKQEGLPITEYTLRRAIRSGSIPCRIVGKKYFISWDNFVKWITCENGSDNPVASQGTMADSMYTALAGR